MSAFWIYREHETNATRHPAAADPAPSAETPTHSTAGAAGTTARRDHRADPSGGIVMWLQYLQSALLWLAGGVILTTFSLFTVGHCAALTQRLAREAAVAWRGGASARGGGAANGAVDSAESRP